MQSNAKHTGKEDIMSELNLTDIHIEAVELHQKIITNGEIAVRALLNLCQELKEMRDRQLYKELGYASFDIYVEEAVGIKTRQAYTYIATYEKLGAKILEEHSRFGITKLELLSQLPATDVEDVISGANIGGMSVRDVKQLVEEYNNAGEQINMLNNEIKQSDSERDIFKKELERLREENAEKEKLLERLKAEPIEAVSNSDVERIKKEAASTAKAEAVAEAQKVQEERDRKHTAEMQAAICNAIKQAEEEANLKIAQAQKSATEAAEAAQIRATDLAKKLELKDGSESVSFAVYFEQMQTAYNKMLEQADALKGKGKVSQADKLILTLQKALEAMAKQI